MDEHTCFHNQRVRVEPSSGQRHGVASCIPQQPRWEGGGGAWGGAWEGHGEGVGWRGEDVGWYGCESIDAHRRMSLRRRDSSTTSERLRVRASRGQSEAAAKLRPVPGMALVHTSTAKVGREGGAWEGHGDGMGWRGRVWDGCVGWHARADAYQLSSSDQRVWCRS